MPSEQRKKGDFESLLNSTVKATWEHYQLNVPEITYKLFRIGLEEYEIKDIQRAFVTYLTDPFIDQSDPPTVGDIARILNGGDLHAKALEQWASVERSIRSLSSNASVCFEDPVTMCVIQDMGGWRKLSACLETDIPILESRFVDRYESTYQAVTSKRREIPRKFTGVAVDHNREYGYLPDDHEESVVKIGKPTDNHTSHNKPAKLTKDKAMFHQKTIGLVGRNRP